MSAPSELALTWLGNATAAVTLAAAAVWLLLRLTCLQSPTVHRFAWFAVLLQGIVIWRVSIELPLLPATDPAMNAARRGDAHDTQRPREDLPIQSEIAGPSQLDGPIEDTARVSPWPSIILGTWFCGIVLTALHACVRYLSFCRALGPRRPASIEWTKELTDLCDELAIPSGRVLLHVTEEFGPALCLLPSGYRLLVPGTAWRELSAVQRHAILRHELAHYLRGDLWKSMLMRVLALFQWFNPLAWYAAGRFDDAAEWACDDAVESGEQDHVFDYLRALVFLGASQRPSTSLQAAVRGGSLQFRVLRLSLPSRKDSKMKKFAIVAVILTVAAAGLTQLHLATAQTPPSSNNGKLTPAPREKAVPDTASEPASLGPGTPSPSSPEAVIDLSRVFKESREFQRRKDALSNKVNLWQQKMKQEQERLVILQQKQRSTSNGELKRQLEIELQADVADFKRRDERFRNEALDEEATACHELFERIRSEVAKYAKQNGIRLVRRLQSVVVAGEPVDATDRKAILARLNRDIIYSDPQQIDITDAIIERLNARTNED